MSFKYCLRLCVLSVPAGKNQGLTSFPMTDEADNSTHLSVRQHFHHRPVIGSRG